MKLRSCLVLICALLSVLSPLQGVRAIDDPARLLIVEVAVSGNEFIEIYNPTEDPINLACFALQYRVATSTLEKEWNNKYRFACDEDVTEKIILAPHSRLLFAAYDEPTEEGELQIGSGLRDAGGQLRLIQQGEDGVIVHDQLGYGDAVQGEGTKGVAEAPANKQSVKRKTNEDGAFIDTNDNARDFIVSNTPTPQRDDIDADMPNEDPEPGTGSGEYAVLQINELLPDPVHPGQDDIDEFIEIYNPTDAEVSLKGYGIQSGGNYQYGFIFEDEAHIAAHGFVAIRSADSDLVLSNGGGKVRLLDPDEKVQDEVVYPLALAGQSYAKTAKGWEWSTTPSPAAENIITISLPPAAKSIKAATVKKPTVSKSSTSKPKVAATKKSATKAANTSTPSIAKAAAIDNSPNFWILLPIGSLVAGYALYEYRRDIAMWWRKLQLAIKVKQ